MGVTLAAVALAGVDVGTVTIVGGRLIGAVKSSFVLRIFMHLKFENKMFSLMIIAVILLIGSVIFITLLDYLYR